MNLFRTLRSTGFALFVGLGLSSCLQAPDYAIEPRIEEKTVTVFRRNDVFGLRDSVEVALDFQDGDGDLGLDVSDNTGPFAFNNGLNRYYENYFIQPQYKNRQGVFVPLLPLGSANGRFIRLTKEDAKPGPIKGVLRRSLIISLLDTAYSARPGTEYRFEVVIVDRTLHESNKVVTKPVKL